MKCIVGSCNVLSVYCCNVVLVVVESWVVLCNVGFSDKHCVSSFSVW